MRTRKEFLHKGAERRDGGRRRAQELASRCGTPRHHTVRLYFLWPSIAETAPGLIVPWQQKWNSTLMGGLGSREPRSLSAPPDGAVWRVCAIVLLRERAREERQRSSLTLHSLMRQ